MKESDRKRSRQEKMADRNMGQAQRWPAVRYRLAYASGFNSRHAAKWCRNHPEAGIPDCILLPSYSHPTRVLLQSYCGPTAVLLAACSRQ